MPRTRALIGGEGVTFANSFVSLSECCPSRATFLTGQYAHNHGVRSIRPPFGGFKQLDGSETLAVWLRRAGYATGMVGKYLNGYGNGPRARAAGLDRLRGPAGPLHLPLLRLHVQRQRPARVARHATRPTRSPSGRWPSSAAGPARRRSSCGRTTSRRTPVARAISPTRRTWTRRSPPPATAAPSSAPRCPSRPRSTRPTCSDKPPRIQRRQPLKQWEVAALADVHRQRLASLLAVDEGVARIVAALREAGELGDTLLIFTSDNGFMTGEHRVRTGKVLPYEPSIRVPLLMRGPGLPRGERREQLVWNGDLAPTILDAAGASAPFALDGPRCWPRCPTTARSCSRARPSAAPTGCRSFTGMRTARYKYVKYVWGAAELYDLWRDPDELDNLARSPALRGVRERLARELEQLRSCAGAGCR